MEAEQRRLEEARTGAVPWRKWGPTSPSASGGRSGGLHQVGKRVAGQPTRGFRYILNSALAAQSLAEILNERLLGPATFADLHAREVQGDSPRVMVNTTLYNDGRGFVLTTLPPEASRYDFFEDLRRSATQRGRTAEYSPILVRRWESLRGVTPLDLQIDPCHIKVAGAVTASAAFPPLVGPITFRVGDEEFYWHTGDGGLYENGGIESLAVVFLAQLQAKKARRALILSFDSSYPFAVGFRLLSRRALPWTHVSYDFSRIPGIMEERATAYASLFFRSLQIEGVFPDNQTLHVVFLRHTDAQWKDDLSDLPEACRRIRPCSIPQPRSWSVSQRSLPGSPSPRSVTGSCSSPPPPRWWRRTGRRSRTSWPAARRRSRPRGDAVLPRACGCVRRPTTACDQT
jgi:hypothetical protein